MRKVLMITYPYYPANVAGAHRPAKLSKYLRYFGWEPIVICRNYPINHIVYDPLLAREKDPCRVYRVQGVDNKIIHKIETLFWKIFGAGSEDYRYPFPLYVRMERIAEKIVKEGKIDVIWSTYRPGLDHLIASYLSRKYSIPWIADFRDLPDQSYTSRCIKYAVEQESRVCKNASALVAVTEELANKLRSRHNVPVYTIFNGFDPDDYAVEVNLAEKFVIRYFGILYEFRDPTPLFEAMDLLFKRKQVNIENVAIEFYGSEPNRIENLSSGYKWWNNCVKYFPRLPHPEMVKMQKSSQILLLLTGSKQGGAIPSKLYDYLAANRPILNIPGDGAGVDRILEETNAGVSLADPVEIANWIEDAYNKWLSIGYVPYRGDREKIQKYSRKVQAKQLAELLDRIVT